MNVIMNNSTKYSNFTDKINQLEQELETTYSQSIEEFPNQPQQQSAILFESMAQKVMQLLEEIPEENKKDFQEYVKEKLNLKNKDDTKNFILSAPNQIDNLIKSHSLSSNS